MVVDLSKLPNIRALIDRLVGENPWDVSEWGMFCHFCDAGECEHAEDCPWVEAVDLLGIELKDGARKG